MSCKQLGGACDQQFHADSFEEIARQSQAHGREMSRKQDAAHLKAMRTMKVLLSDPERMQAWMKARREEFERLPES